MRPSRVHTEAVASLVGGTLVLLSALVERIVNLAGLPREVVVSQTREILDHSL